MKYDWEKLDNLCLQYYIDRYPSHGIDHITSVLNNLDLLLECYILLTRNYIKTEKAREIANKK